MRNQVMSSGPAFHYPEYVVTLPRHTLKTRNHVATVLNTRNCLVQEEPDPRDPIEPSAGAYQLPAKKNTGSVGRLSVPFSETFSDS
jgi:hypothetical protein